MSSTMLGGIVSPMMADADRTATTSPRGYFRSAAGLEFERGPRRHKNKVCTMCTPWASDRAVHRLDWLGLAIFTGVVSVCKSWSPVRVPPRAPCFRRSAAGWPAECVQSVNTCCLGAALRGLVATSRLYSLSWCLACMPSSGPFLLGPEGLVGSYTYSSWLRLPRT